MIGDVNIIHPEALLKALQAQKEDKMGLLSNADFELKQWETHPLPGFEAPEGFPHCCEYHKELLKIGEEQYLLFPNCCEAHQTLKWAPWFRKENYAYLPTKLVNTIAYTNHCITTNISSQDWYKKITDYIDYTRSSYGQLPEGYGAPVGLSLYLNNLKLYIESEKQIPDGNRVALLRFLEQENVTKKSVEPTDINLLIDKYRQWLKIFPFELSMFQHLKPYFEQQLPILSGPPSTNQYTGMVGYQLSTKRELLQFLTNTTLSILKEINSRNLQENGQLDKAETVQMELVMANRRLELEELEQLDGQDRKTYIRLLKNWFRGEKQFLKELLPLLVKPARKIDFVRDLLAGMKALQKNDDQATCIRHVREDLPHKETLFRYWFKDFFAARYEEAVVTAEEEKGYGRIDLKIAHPAIGDKLVEFKGWWNRDKAFAAEQICSYLTDFEKEGYVFMINHLKKSIANEYRQLMTNTANGYVAHSWKEHSVDGANLVYFTSKHRAGTSEKTLYHFVFNVWFTVNTGRRNRKK